MSRLNSSSMAREFAALFATGTLANVSDCQLLDQFISDGDEHSFRELIARHGPLVLSICRRSLHDAHDIEDAFSGHLLDPGSQGRFVARSERTFELALWRRLARCPSREIIPGGAETPHEAAATQLGWPLGTVKSRIATARQTLSRRLTQRGVSLSAMAAILRHGLRLTEPSSLVSAHLFEIAVEAAAKLRAGSSVLATALPTPSSGLVNEARGMTFASRMSAAALLMMTLTVVALTVPTLLSARQARPAAKEPQNVFLAYCPDPAGHLLAICGNS